MSGFGFGNLAFLAQSAAIRAAGTVPEQNYTTGTPVSVDLSVYFEGPVSSYAIASGALPAGLSLNTSTGAVTGTPT